MRFLAFAKVRFSIFRRFWLLESAKTPFLTKVTGVRELQDGLSYRVLKLQKRVSYRIACIARALELQDCLSYRRA